MRKFYKIYVLKNKSPDQKIVIIDNYDSFTYNLVHLVEKIIDDNVIVYLNDEFELSEIELFDKIIISPGPGLPENAGKTLELIKHFSSRKSILGVCLGQQVIAVAFDGKLKNLDEVYHGVSHPIYLKEIKQEKQNYLFKNLPNKFNVGRYHSWVIDQNNFPVEFNITAVDEKGEIMAIEHQTLDIQAVQFHPESILTSLGEKIMKNWLNV